ncbi:PspC domain-containing protein [Kutzneria kofuensis]|uniref:Phage shock protein PspC (Stress-responsive transcriptional regulator) n=1 Tax=Kutzneria kofuensis TaxID=103725 RepID=A0A7W9NHZ6_9PSEU|nr:PspC domain-containing protein [Kutzneria kofuensis]MBB5893330.1 phage shock protein PspC (stress-responsive transcriptional regulator) [Kutzneria kofuensis]
MNTTKHSGINIEHLVADFWATRPRRPRQGRMVAGVAAGIGRRYDIDPVIVRVALVVCTVYGGAGLLFYLLAWLTLAEENDEASALEAMVGRGRSSMSRGFTILLCLLCVPAFGWLWGGQFGFFSGVLSAAALLGGLFLLHRNRAGLGVPGAPTTTSGGPMTAPSYAPGAAASTEWDPLGAAPLQWDLHDPNEPVTTQLATSDDQDKTLAVRPRKRHSAVGGVTMGLAVLTAAALLIFKAGLGLTWLTLPHILGIVAGVLAGGLVVGAFARGGRGLIVPTVLVGVAAVALTNSPNGGDSGFGDLRANPTDRLDASYSRSFGDVRLDLTDFKFDKEKPARTTVSVDAGEARVIVPANVNVEATCTANVGDVRCLTQRADWRDVNLHVVDNVPNAVGTIQLDVHAGAGDVEVYRG